MFLILFNKLKENLNISLHVNTVLIVIDEYLFDCRKINQFIW